MDLATGIVEILFKMVIVTACVVGGTFFGAFLRKRKDKKTSSEK